MPEALRNRIETLHVRQDYTFRGELAEGLERG